MNSMNRLESQNEGNLQNADFIAGKYQNAEITNLIDQIKVPLRSNYISLDLSVF
jgi:hypothetical protein